MGRIWEIYTENHKGKGSDKSTATELPREHGQDTVTFRALLKVNKNRTREQRGDRQENVGRLWRY